MKEMCTSILNYIIQTKDSLKEFVKSEVKYGEQWFVKSIFLNVHTDHEF